MLKQLPAESVHCVVTSPPYLGLRDYRVKGQLGLESSPMEYVAKLVEVFREVRRVLRRDGTVWLNLGDSFAHGGCGARDPERWPKQSRNDHLPKHAKRFVSRAHADELVFKPKDLMGMAWRVAFALQDDGWWLRDDIVWNKLNPMPESVTDRPTRSHEFVFLLAKSEHYFYDAYAIREPRTSEDGDANTFRGGAYVHDAAVDNSGTGGKRKTSGNKARKFRHERGGPEEHGGRQAHSVPWDDSDGKRNKRDVWSIGSTPFAEAHFATFPEKLVEPCVFAGTSEHGCCAECLAPYERQLETVRTVDGEPAPDLKASRNTSKGEPTSGNGVGHGRIETKVKHVGWVPGCQHRAPLAPCTVLDPFAGAATAGVVALKAGRNFVGVELNPDYCLMARRRLERVSPLFAREVG